MKFRISALAATAMLVSSLSAQAADLISFDPTGTGTVNPLTALFDWAPGSALADNVFTGSTINNGTAFTTYYQANLGAAYQSNGTTATFVNGTGGVFVTGVAAFGETVQCLNAGCTSANFLFNNTAPNFFNIYVSSTGGNNLTGANFVNSTPILTAHVISTGFQSIFSVNTTVAPSALDQSATPAAFWSNTQTLSGVGSSSIQVVVDSVNKNYFPDLLVGSILTLSDFNTSQNLPFKQVNPSECLATATVNCAISSQVGTINGATGPDVLFQADANSSFTRVPVPEPASLALVGLGLVGIGVARRRKRASV